MIANIGNAGAHRQVDCKPNPLSPFGSNYAPRPAILPHDRHRVPPDLSLIHIYATDYDFVITHPEGYELDPKFVGNARVEYDQMKAFEGADFVYACLLYTSCLYLPE